MTSSVFIEGSNKKKNPAKLSFQENLRVFRGIPRRRGDEVGIDTQKRGPASSPSDEVGANKKTSTPNTSDRTSYFDKDWNAFAQQKNGSIQWIP